ncbi:cytosine permease [Symbiopectobacterium purcellii]|uniref:Cytosine permease n=1 Tax=Symbiopectobacterium purcellii TaxID=2871826 RepID=A0ABX9AG94_9ENTR|nr:cytosine permease [Symbiopectobacterium purcellii]QZN94177.1 cytosine permease [Symbiopectobacterium purcellii]
MSKKDTISTAIQLKLNIYDYEYETVPGKARKSWYVIALIWLAIGIDISGLFFGVFLSSGLPFPQAVIATLVGSALLGVLAGFCANVGYGCGLSTTLLSIAVFGRWGGGVVGLLTSISLLGWFAFQLDFFSVLLQKSLFTYGFEVGRLPILLFGMALMTSTAIWGFRALAQLSIISVPLMVILIITGVTLAAVDIQSPDPSIITSPISMGTAISYVVSIWIVSTVMSPDIARYAKTRKDAFLGAGLGFFLGNSFTILLSLFLTHMVGSDDLVNTFFIVGLGSSAILVLVFAQWTTNSANLVFASLGLSAITKIITRPTLIIVLSIVGLVLAQNGMINNLTSFLSLLGAFISPIAGVYLVEYYFIRDNRLTERGASQDAINISGAMAWICGSIIGLMTSPDIFNLFTLTSVSALDGIGASMIVYFTLKKCLSVAR